MRARSAAPFAVAMALVAPFVTSTAVAQDDVLTPSENPKEPGRPADPVQTGRPAGQVGSPGPPGADKDVEREGRAKPYASDQRTAHFYVDGFFTSVFPVGNVAPESTVNEVASFGFLAGGSLGVGVSRDAVIDVRGGYGLLSSPTECVTCSSNLATASLGLSYHMLQGASFDPWIRFGAGYRTFQIDHTDGESARVVAVATGRYHAVDVAQVSIGGNFFPAPGFGFGPWLAVDMGTVVSWPDGSLEGTRPYAFFQVGVEIELDPVKWAQPTPPAATAVATPASF